MAPPKNSNLFAKFFLNNEELLMNIIEHHMPTLGLLIIMVQRAKIKDDIISGLKAGESYLGDYDKCGMTRQQYRTAKDNLKKWDFATFRVTNKGTIGCVLPNPIFEVYDFGKQPTSQPSANQRPTTNKEGTRKVLDIKINTKENLKLLTLYRDKHSNGSTRFRFYNFFIEHVEKIKTSLTEEKLEAVDRKLSEFREKLGDERAKLEIESFCDWHGENGSEFKSIIARLNVWLSNKIKPIGK